MASRTGPKIVAYVAVLLAAVVGADRLLAQRLYAEPGRLVPAYRTFNEPSEGVKLKQLADTKVRLDTLILGNSRALAAVNPDAFDHDLAAHGVNDESFNLAMPTIDVRFWPPFFERYYDRAPPRNVLIGVIPRDLDVRNVVAGVQGEAFRASPGFINHHRTTVWKDAEEWLADLFTLRGRGNEIRHAGIEALLRGRKLDHPGFRPSGERGGATFDPSLFLPKAELAAKAQELAGRHGTIHLRVGAAQIAALERLDRLTRARGGCLTLFTPPILYDREQFGTIEVARDFERLLRDFVRAHPTVGLLDIGPKVQGSYTVGDFADGDHLSPQGAQRFSRELADAIAPSMRGRTCGVTGQR